MRRRAAVAASAAPGPRSRSAETPLVGAAAARRTAESGAASPVLAVFQAA